MGAVYKAKDPELDRVVAVKTLSPLVLLADEALRAEFLERFRREARAAGRLSHPNIVSVYDLGYDEASRTPFIVMEYVAGAALSAALSETPVLPLARGLEIVEQVAAALEEAHRHGIVHRDIKPANVFLDAQGRVKVGDFGVARIEGSELTQAGISLGTPGYLAPEVLRGGAATVRSDVFALGVLAYQVVTGKPAFGAATREAAAFAVLEREPAPPVAVRPEVPPRVSDAVMRAIAKVPEVRTPSAAEFLKELRGEARPPTFTATARAALPAPRPRWPLWLAAALAVLALGLAALAVAYLRREPATVAAPAPVASPAAPAGRRPSPRAPAARIEPGATGEADAGSWEGSGEEAKRAQEREREAAKKAEEREREARKKAEEREREEKKREKEWRKRNR
jgi:serine/threonine-protein kinase